MKALTLLRQMAADELRLQHIANPETLKKPVKVYTDKTANGITRCITDFLKLSGSQVERVNTTGRPLDRNIATDVIGYRHQTRLYEWIRLNNTPGSFYLISTIQGRSVSIMVKYKATNYNYQQAGIKLYQKYFESAGGLYYIARDFQNFYEWYALTFH
jgi:hypothetical protein